MSLFNEVAETLNQDTPKYLTKGINSNVVIGEISLITPDIGSPYINIKLHREGFTIDDSTSFRLYMTDKAKSESIKRLAHLIGKVIDKNTILEINNNSATVEEFIAAINPLVAGKTIRNFKITAKQYITNDGNIRDRLSIGFIPFASQDTNHKLRWDENNSYDYEKVSVDDLSPKVSF